MQRDMVLLVSEALAAYFLVLGTHALRHRFGMAPFYALLGGITAVMSWVTDAGVSVHFAGITFMVGSTVFYTSLLLGVFVVYVFDGPRPTRITISTVAMISALLPAIAAILHLQTGRRYGVVSSTQHIVADLHWCHHLYVPTFRPRSTK